MTAPATTPDGTGFLVGIGVADGIRAETRAARFRVLRDDARALLAAVATLPAPPRQLLGVEIAGVGRVVWATAQGQSIATFEKKAHAATIADLPTMAVHVAREVEAAIDYAIDQAAAADGWRQLYERERRARLAAEARA